MNKGILILAPHPDDESIIGLLPLRLQEECGFRVWVVPATLGSRVERQTARKLELQAACSVLGFQLRLLKPDPSGLNLSRLIENLNPAVIFIPHANDGHATHRAVHRLGVSAMDKTGRKFHVVETEYWHPLARPNLMVAANPKHLSKLRRALACHAGEIARNDYAARLPAWMIDNVRRGAERIGDAGSAAPAFTYATLYRARRRTEGSWQAEFRGGRIVKTATELGEIAALWG
jgi:N-acetylglucosamine malate deacetylase 1